MSRAYDNAADGRYQQGGRRNLIINGAMEVAQRATSSTSGGYVSLDRWRVNQSGASTTFSQETFTVGEEIGQSRNYARFAVSTGNDNAGIQQRIENITTVPGGETITISFWAKGTNPGGGSLIAGYAQNFGSGGSSQVTVTNTDVAVTTGWARYTLSIDVPSISGKTIGTSSFVKIHIGGSSVTDGSTIDISQVQLELGNIATPFEHRSFGEELALCQRYYQKSFAQGVTPQNGQYTVNVTTAWESSTNARGNWIPFPVEMRATPTFTQYGNSSNWQVFTGSSWQTTTNSNVGSSVKSYGFYPTIVGGVTNSNLHPWYAKGDYTVDAEL